MSNILKAVQTYQKGGLALLENLNCFVSTANTKFKDFENMTANLGSTVTFDLPPRMIANDTLVATFQDVEQRVQSLTVDKAKNVAFNFTAQEYLFNIENNAYTSPLHESAIAELSAVIEADVASIIETNVFRFYGDGTTAINSYGQLAKALAYFRNFGAPHYATKGYLSDIAVADIVNSGLSQFVMRRNEEAAASWDIGAFSNCDWYQSNFLPIHTSGNVGENATTLTVTGVTTDADGGISAITCSGGGADADAIKANDLLQFQDGVVGFSNVRFLTFIGHTASANPVQIRATANAASVADSVTISIYPKLYVAAGRNQNITTAIVAGMELKALPSHRRGLITAGNPLYLAMPRLPDQSPYTTANAYDDDTGVSLRLTTGAVFGQNQIGSIFDSVWGKTLVPEYAMAVVFPI